MQQVIFYAQCSISVYKARHSDLLAPSSTRMIPVKNVSVKTKQDNFPNAGANKFVFMQRDITISTKLACAQEQLAIKYATPMKNVDGTYSLCRSSFTSDFIKHLESMFTLSI